MGLIIFFFCAIMHQSPFSEAMNVEHFLISNQRIYNSREYRSGNCLKITPKFLLTLWDLSPAPFAPPAALMASSRPPRPSSTGGGGGGAAATAGGDAMATVGDWAAVTESGGAAVAAVG